MWLPVGAYLLMIPFLGTALLNMPLVVANAPLGIMTILGETGASGYFGTFSNLVLHLLFWGLWFGGVFGRKLLDRRSLSALWWTLAIMLTLTVSGCATLCLRAG